MFECMEAVGELAQRALKENRSLSIRLSTELISEAREWVSRNGCKSVNRFTDEEVVEIYLGD